MINRSKILRLAESLKLLTYDEMEQIACELRASVMNQIDEGDHVFDYERYEDWMSLIQGWATGKLEE